jgi:ubiquinone/menaquinone biosynthesis C-methylase UbiE
LSRTPWTDRLAEVLGAWPREPVYYRKNVRDKIVSLMEENRGSILLDAGCGTGILREHLPKWIKYVGLDFTPEFIDYCRGKFKDEFVLAKVEKIPYPDMYFWAVNSTSVINHNANWRDLIKEMMRVSQKYLVILTTSHDKATAVIGTKPVLRIRFNPKDIIDECSKYGAVEFEKAQDRNADFTLGLFTVKK